MQHITTAKQTLKRKEKERMKANSRDVSKFLNEYEQIRIKSKEQAGNIYCDEMQQLYDMGKGQIFESMALSWKFGFIAGLHYAKNQRRKQETM